jgi:hypothetical protein
VTGVQVVKVRLFPDGPNLPRNRKNKEIHCKTLILLNFEIQLNYFKIDSIEIVFNYTFYLLSKTLT